MAQPEQSDVRSRNVCAQSAQSPDLLTDPQQALNWCHSCTSNPGFQDVGIYHPTHDPMTDRPCIHPSQTTPPYRRYVSTTSPAISTYSLDNDPLTTSLMPFMSVNVSPRYTTDALRVSFWISIRVAFGRAVYKKPFPVRGASCAPIAYLSGRTFCFRFPICYIFPPQSARQFLLCTTKI